MQLRLQENVRALGIRGMLAVGGVLILVAGLLVAFVWRGAGEESSTPDSGVDAVADSSGRSGPSGAIRSSGTPSGGAAPTEAESGPGVGPTGVRGGTGPGRSSAAGADSQRSAAGARGPGGAGDAAGPPAAVPSTEPAPECRDSNDARCGPFRWDPSPTENLPLRVFLELDTVVGDPDRNLVLAGRETQFFVYATDDDARIESDCIMVDFGDGTTMGSCPDRVVPLRRFGPWFPPAPVADRQVRTFRHTYSGPGRHRLTARVRSTSGPPGYDPFGDEVEVTLAVEVI